MDDIERNSIIPSIEPVRKIRAKIIKRERRELMHPYKKTLRGEAKKRKKPGIKQIEYLTSDTRTSEEIEQDLTNYKSDLKIRITFDRDFP